MRRSDARYMIDLIKDIDIVNSIFAKVSFEL